MVDRCVVGHPISLAVGAMGGGAVRDPTGDYRQSTAIAAFASVSTPISQKIAGGTEPLRR